MSRSSIRGHTIFLLSICHVILAGIFLATPAHAQNTWKKLKAFDSPIQCVKFLDLPGPPRIGFLGAAPQIWKTTDGGTTWNQSNTSLPTIYARDFTFKDSLTGWFADNLNGCYKTTDGGLNWYQSFPGKSAGKAIYYNPFSHLLFLSVWGENQNTFVSSVSSDEGATWSTFGNALTGYAFSDDLHGVIGVRGGTNYLTTTDAGVTWQTEAINIEGWQPAVFPNSSLGFVANETGQQILKTTDNWNSYTIAFGWPQSGSGTLTGDIGIGFCDRLFVQFYSPLPGNNSGFYSSEDSGKNWNPIGGPLNTIDTRFYIRGQYIFAGELIQTDPAPSSPFTGALWEYVGDTSRTGTDVTPTLSLPSVAFRSDACTTSDTTIYIRYSNACHTARLVGAAIDNPNFILSKIGNYPSTLDEADSLKIVFSPSGRDAQSGKLKIRYVIGRDTNTLSIPLTATITTKKNFLRFTLDINGGKSATIAPGDTTNVTLTSRSMLPDAAGIDMLDLLLRWDRDVITPAGTIIFPDWKIVQTSVFGDSETITIARLSHQDIPAGAPIVSMRFSGNVAIHDYTTVALQRLLINGGDSVYQNCTLTSFDTSKHLQAAIDTVGIAILPGCGQPTLRAALRNVLPILIQSITPNPAPGSHQVALSIFSKEPTTISLQVTDLLGNTIGTWEHSLATGQNVVTIHTPKSEGLYFIAARSPLGSSVKKLIVRSN